LRRKQPWQSNLSEEDDQVPRGAYFLFIETFNVLRGGEYMFMPSLTALKWLADLKDNR